MLQQLQSCGRPPSRPYSNLGVRFPRLLKSCVAQSLHSSEGKHSGPSAGTAGGKNAHRRCCAEWFARDGKFVCARSTSAVARGNRLCFPGIGADRRVSGGARIRKISSRQPRSWACSHRAMLLFDLCLLWTDFFLESSSKKARRVNSKKVRSRVSWF